MYISCTVQRFVIVAVHVGNAVGIIHFSQRDITYDYGFAGAAGTGDAAGFFVDGYAVGYDATVDSLRCI